MPESPTKGASLRKVELPPEIKSPSKDTHSPIEPRMYVPRTTNATRHRRVTPCNVQAPPHGVRTGRITKQFLPTSAREKLIYKTLWINPAPEPGPTAALTDDEKLWVFHEELLLYDGLLSYIDKKMYNHALAVELEKEQLEIERIAKDAANKAWFEKFRKLTTEQQAQITLDRVLDVAMPVPK